MAALITFFWVLPPLATGFLCLRLVEWVEHRWPGRGHAAAPALVPCAMFAAWSGLGLLALPAAAGVLACGAARRPAARG